MLKNSIWSWRARRAAGVGRQDSPSVPARPFAWRRVPALIHFRFRTGGLSLLVSLPHGSFAGGPALCFFHLFFLLHLTRYLGFFPANTYSNVEPYFNLQHGAFETLDKGNEFQLELKQSEQLARILTSTIETFEQLPFSRNERSSLLRNIIAYLQLHLEGLGKIKSLDVLETVFES